MPSREQPKKSVDQLRERIVALVKRSAEKFEEMKGVQERIDQLAVLLAKGNDADRPQTRNPKPGPERGDQP